QVSADAEADPEKGQEEDGEVVGGAEGLPVGEESQDDEAAGRQLMAAGCVAAEKALKDLARLRSSPNLRSMQRRRRERLDAFIPRLLAQAVEQEKPDLVLERVPPLVEAVARPPASLVLLTETPAAPRQLLTLCAAARWIAAATARIPL
ncbi:bifunctional glutamine synthetase adenylyltransferase/deadenyltransferase, partial [Pseudomonas syringae]